MYAGSSKTKDVQKPRAATIVKEEAEKLLQSIGVCLLS